MSDTLKETSFEGKKNFKLPEGAVVISNSHRISVEEIENGFLLRKSYDIKYMVDDDTKYDYFSKTWFSKENPIKITIPKDKSLADKLD